MIKNIIRGGQTTLHSIRMFVQVAAKIMGILTCVFFLGLLFFGYLKTTSHEQYAALKVIEAEVRQHLLADWAGGNHLAFKTETGISLPQIQANDFLNSKGVMDLKKRWVKVIASSLYQISMVCLVTLISLIGFLLWQGYSAKQKKYLRGAKRCSVWRLKWMIKKDQRSGYTLAGVPLVKGGENRHMLFCGTPGTGKSVATKELMDQVRSKAQRAVVYDIDQAFIAEFYRPGKDIILNPLDDRCPNWNIWKECTDFSDYRRIAESMMPDHLAASDSFWISAARNVFAAALGKLQEQNRCYTPTLLEYLFSSNTDGLHQLVKGTVAEPLTTDKLEKMAMSIVATLATYCSSLLYVKESKNTEENTFSIREWVKQDSDSWLFITTTQEKKSTLKPLFSVWVDIAIHTLLSLAPNLQRKIWFLTDEFASLHRLPSVMDLISRSRKYGGCFVATVQDFSQIQSIYGKEDASTLIGLFGTRLYFRIGDTMSARMASEYFGKAEISEAREGLSYGAHEMRDGMSISRHIREEPIVMESEIMLLNDLEAFIKMPGEWPVTQLKFKLKHREGTEKTLVERKVQLGSAAPLIQEALKHVPLALNDVPLVAKELTQEGGAPTEPPIVEEKEPTLFF